MALERTTTAGRALPRSQKRSDARRLRDRILDHIDEESPVDRLPTALDKRGIIAELAPLQSRNLNDYITEIEGLWHSVQERFLAIGRAIIAARGLVEQQALAESNARGLRPADRRSHLEGRWREFLGRLPFTASVACQLEQVVRAVESGRIKLAELPNNYSVAYQLTTLSNAELEAARRHQGIVGPTATRSRIIEFKRRLRQAALERVEVVRQRRVRILEAMERLKAELAECDRELSGTGPVIEGMAEPQPDAPER